MIKQTQATAVWKGGLKDGHGVIDSQHGALKNIAYDFAKRFGEARGTNPEELIASAHAACFSMAFSSDLEKNKLTPHQIATTANVVLDLVDSKPTVTEIHLTTEVRADGEAEAIRRAAETAKAGCPISRLLNAKITLDVKVV